MVKVVSNCVDCPPEIGCIGSACPYAKGYEYICDECHGYAEYQLKDTGEMFCEDCFRDYLYSLATEQQVKDFEENGDSLSEIAETLGVKFETEENFAFD